MKLTNPLFSRSNLDSPINRMSALILKIRLKVLSFENLEMISESAESSDGQIGIQAFLNKEKPKFQGK